MYRGWPASACTILLVGVAGCAAVEVAETPPAPEVAEPSREKVVTDVGETAPPSGAVIVRMHAGSDAEMPEGATATVSLEGPGASRTAELPKGERLVRFDGLAGGRYDLHVAVNSRGVEIGAYSYFVDVGATVADVTVQIDYRRADLVVEANVETASERRYLGTASAASDNCPGSGPEGPVPSDLVLATDGDGIELAITHFQGETLRLTGRIAPETGPSLAAGTFESSDGQSGTWELAHLTAPTLGAIAAALKFENRTQACQSTLEFAGLPEDGQASAARVANDVGPTVEVVGHGRTRTATLGRNESVVRFEGLLVGPYDVFVGFHQGEGLADGRRESVVLDTGGARVDATFEMEWAPDTSPQAGLEGYEALVGTYRGKSVVAGGSPDCMGSIPLVDTTELTVSASGDALEMTLDSFYGKILTLTAHAGIGQRSSSASGTYRSSDDKTGSWTVDRIAAPTSRSVAMLVKFNNETDSCRATFEFAGVR